VTPAPTSVATASGMGAFGGAGGAAGLTSAGAGALTGGAAGISIGRNAFQHKHPAQFVRAAACIVHKNKSVEEALKILEE